MSKVSVRNVSVMFPVFGANSRSFKKQLIGTATGGKIDNTEDDSVTIRALDNVSLELNDGDRVGLMGHNGAGKSTLLRILAGLYIPTAGTVEIEGRVSAMINPSAGIDPESTGLENIFMRGYVLGMSKGEIESKIESISEMTGLGNFINLPVRTYSQGMSSRLAFAISTSVNPDILLIDEGLGAGDASFQTTVDRVLKDLLQSAKILVFASHNQSMMNDYCNRIVTFEAGKLIENPS